MERSFEAWPLSQGFPDILAVCGHLPWGPPESNEKLAPFPPKSSCLVPQGCQQWHPRGRCCLNQPLRHLKGQPKDGSDSPPNILKPELGRGTQRGLVTRSLPFWPHMPPIKLHRAVQHGSANLPKPWQATDHGEPRDNESRAKPNIKHLRVNTSSASLRCELDPTCGVTCVTSKQNTLDLRANNRSYRKKPRCFSCPDRLTMSNYPLSTESDPA